MAGQWNVSCLSAGLPGGQQIGESYTVVGASVVGESLLVTLAAGDNTVAVPAGAISVGVILPATNTQTVKFRTSANIGDAGLPLAVGDPFGPYSFRGLNVTSIVLNASAAVPGVQITFL